MERNTNLKSNKAASKAKKPGLKPVEPNARDYVQQQLSSMGKLILQAEKLILDAAGKGNCSLSFFPGGAHQRKVIYCLLDYYSIAHSAVPWKQTFYFDIQKGPHGPGCMDCNADGWTREDLKEIKVVIPPAPVTIPKHKTSFKQDWISLRIQKGEAVEKMERKLTRILGSDAGPEQVQVGQAVPDLPRVRFHREISCISFFSSPYYWNIAFLSWRPLAVFKDFVHLQDVLASIFGFMNDPTSISSMQRVRKSWYYAGSLNRAWASLYFDLTQQRVIPEQGNHVGVIRKKCAQMWLEREKNHFCLLKRHHDWPKHRHADLPLHSGQTMAERDLQQEK